MRHRTIPGTDLSLSVIGFGAWAIGGDYWGDDVSDETSIAAVRKAVDVGINWFDTAPLYGHGHSEEVLVKALGPRLKKVIVATKVGIRSDGDHAISDLTADHIRLDVERTLSRLGVERIDLLQVHWPCEKNTPIEVSFSALAELMTEGKVRHVGVCNYNARALALIRDVCPIVALQTPYSMLRREFEGPLQQACAELEMGVLAYEPLCRGLLTGKFDQVPEFPETDLRSRDDRFSGGRFFHAQALARDLTRIGRKIGAPTAAVALGWVATRPGVTAVIAGAKTPEQVAQNALAGQLVDRPSLWKVVSKVAAVHGGTPR